MTDEEMTTFEHQMRDAATDEERKRIRELWQPHMMRCLNSTNRRVKTIENLMATRADVEKIFTRINALHTAPSWKDNKLEWLRVNWMWLVVMFYIFQSLLGINVSEYVQRLLGS